MSGASKYSVVVVGLGKRGMHHAEAFANNGRFEIIGLCDVDEARLEAAVQKFGRPKADTNAKSLLQGLKPDVFCFCTLPQLRLEMVRLGVESGARLIAFEKPIALSTNEALEVMKLVRDAGVKTVVSHQHRYGEHYKKVKEIIASGAIGRVHTVYGTATGWMMHMLTHLIDYIRWFNDNAEAEWVVGQASGKAPSSASRAGAGSSCAPPARNPWCASWWSARTPPWLPRWPGSWRTSWDAASAGGGSSGSSARAFPDVLRSDIG